MSGGLFLTLILAVNVAQVIFDMMMAPFEATEHMEIGQRSTAEIAREAIEAGKAQPRLRLPDASTAVRKGTPSELRRDLYFYFIEGSWTRVFAAFAFLFLIVNVFFAALYTLEPGSIANAGADSFADAFFFSVQTMSTIGYGSLSPGTPYGNFVVTVEAADETGARSPAEPRTFPDVHPLLGGHAHHRRGEPPRRHRLERLRGTHRGLHRDPHRS